MKLQGISLQQDMYFRGTYLIGLVMPLLLLIGQFIFWEALYTVNSGSANSSGTGSTIGVFDRQMMFTYILFAFLVNNLLSFRTENQLSRRIIDGSVVFQCIRPVPFTVQNIAEMSGSMLTQGPINLLVVLAFFAIMPNMLVIASPISILLSLLSMILAVILRIMLVSTFSLLCFFTTSHLGLTWTRRALVDFFRGQLSLSRYFLSR